MKTPFTLGTTLRFQTWGWWAFPLLCFLPVAVLWGNIPDNILNGNITQLVISILVYVLPLTWAYIQSWRARKRYNLEHRLLKGVTKKANKQRQSIITKGDKQILDVTDSEREADYYLGNEGGAAGNETIASLMVQLLIKNAKEMRRDSDLTSQVFVRSLVPFKTAVQIPQQVALRVGILFTFVGLLIGLEPVASMFQGSGDQRQAIGELISGLTVAFGTSIAGLGAALMIQFLVTLVDKEYGRTTRQLESAWMDLGHVLSFIRLEGDLPANVDRLSDEIERHRENVNVHTRNLIEQVEKLLEEGREQRQIVAQTYQKLDANQYAIDTLGQAHEAHLKELCALTGNIKSYESRWNSTLNDALAQADELGRERNDKLIKQVSSSVDNLSRSMEQSLASIKTELNGAQQVTPEALVSTFQVLTERLERAVINDAQTHAIQQLVSEVKTLAQSRYVTPEVPSGGQLDLVISNLNDKFDMLAVQSIDRKPKGRSTLGYLSTSLLGGVIGSIVLLMGMAAIGEPAQNTLSQIHSYFAESGE
ncbi:hypothetical protein [Photobacterium kasasachensis]|uniref:hypothetical protein n=1 Tax=Photobacterium kasasachensis TaxID=2910240 RepID=UPI003D13C24C